MFRTKQIAMVAILGLALATATVYATTQSAQALSRTCPPYCNGVNPGGPGGSSSGQDGQGQNSNSQGNTAGGSTTPNGGSVGNTPIYGIQHGMQ